MSFASGMILAVQGRGASPTAEDNFLNTVRATRNSLECKGSDAFIMGIESGVCNASVFPAAAPNTTDTTNFTSASPRHMAWISAIYSVDDPRIWLSIILLTLTGFAAFARFFMCVRTSASARIVKEREKKKILAAMGTAIAWRTTALAKRAEEDEKKEKHKRRERKRHVKEGNSEAAVKSQAQLDEELDSQMPSARKLYELLFDKHEHRRTSYFGLEDTAAGATKVRATERLLICAVRRELREAMAKTRMARGEIPVSPWMDPTEVEPYRDGIRLAETVQLVRDKIYHDLGRPRSGMFDIINNTKEEYDQARHQLKLYANQRWSGYKKIARMILPILPAYLLGTALMICKRIGDSLFHVTLMGTVSQGFSAVQSSILPFMLTRFVMEIFGTCDSTLLAYCQATFLRSLRAALVENVLSQDIAYFDRKPSGELNRRMQGEAQRLADTIFRVPQDIIRNLTSLVVSTMVVWNMHVGSNLIVIVLAAPLVLGGMHFLIVKLLMPMWKRRGGLRSKLSGDGAEIISKIRTVREFGQEISEADLRSARDMYTVENEMHTKAWEAWMWHMNGYGWTAQYAMLFYFGAQYVEQGRMAVAELLTIDHARGGLVHAFRTLMEQSPKIARAIEPLGTISEMLTCMSQIEGNAFEDRRQSRAGPGGKDKKHKSVQLQPATFVGRIEFKNVRFSYPKDPRKMVLKGVSFATDPDGREGRRIRSIALVGETGCGKSTAISLLKRFYSPKSGKILLDGRPISEYCPRHLRRNMAIVAQKTTLLRRSIRENITYGMSPVPSDAEVIACCKQASIWDDINDMPDKLDTQCEFQCFSGGQEQRIAIARALIRRPSILLLDEATSALDAVNERVVQNAIDAMMDARGSGCSITIAHRLTTVRNCDLICVMEKGRVVEEGVHAELMTREVVKDEDGDVVAGFYRNLWEVQQGSDLEEKGKTNGAEEEAKVSRA